MLFYLSVLLHVLYNGTNCTVPSEQYVYPTDQCVSVDGSSFRAVKKDRLVIMNIFPLSSRCDNIPIITKFYETDKCYRFGNMSSMFKNFIDQ